MTGHPCYHCTAYQTSRKGHAVLCPKALVGLKDKGAVVIAGWIHQGRCQRNRKRDIKPYSNFLYRLTTESRKVLMSYRPVNGRPGGSQGASHGDLATAKAVALPGVEKRKGMGNGVKPRLVNANRQGVVSGSTRPPDTRRDTSSASARKSVTPVVPSSRKNR